MEPIICARAMLKGAAEVIRAEFNVSGCPWVVQWVQWILPWWRQPRSSIVWLALLVDPQPIGPCLSVAVTMYDICLIAETPSHIWSVMTKYSTWHTVLFARVVLCRERIAICSPPSFSSSHPMIFDMQNGDSPGLNSCITKLYIRYLDLVLSALLVLFAKPRIGGN